MEIEPMTYEQLDKVLMHVGFSRRRVESKWLRYEHPVSDTVIVLIEKQPHQWVRVTDVVSARRHLVEKGLLTEKEIESLLSRKPAAIRR